MGITGEDLYSEYCLETKNKLKVLKNVVWPDEFKPKLCLLGPKEKNFTDMPNAIKLCINRKYKKLAKRYCDSLENKGYIIDIVYASGASEEFYAKGIVDLVIDIVYSGESAQQYGLKIYEQLFESDIVIIGGKNDNTFN